MTETEKELIDLLMGDYTDEHHGMRYCRYCDSGYGNIPREYWGREYLVHSKNCPKAIHEQSLGAANDLLIFEGGLSESGEKLAAILCRIVGPPRRRFGGGNE